MSLMSEPRNMEGVRNRQLRTVGAAAELNDRHDRPHATQIVHFDEYVNYKVEALRLACSMFQPLDPQKDIDTQRVAANVTKLADELRNYLRSNN